jgi:putative transposase
MVIRRTSHAVYDTQYHLVWAPKYRKWILDTVQSRLLR